jgi:hypothetical protein
VTSWRDVGTFLAGSLAVVLSALLGPLYNRLHRQSFKEKP